MSCCPIHVSNLAVSSSNLNVDEFSKLLDKAESTAVASSEAFAMPVPSRWTERHKLRLLTWMDCLRNSR